MFLTFTQGEFKEKTAIGAIREYLKGCIRENTVKEMANAVYEKYIDYDDEVLLRTIRRLFVVYARRLRMVKQRAFLKYRVRVVESRKEEEEVEIEKEKEKTPFVYKKKVNASNNSNVRNTGNYNRNRKLKQQGKVNNVVNKSVELVPSKKEKESNAVTIPNINNVNNINSSLNEFPVLNELLDMNAVYHNNQHLPKTTSPSSFRNINSSSMNNPPTKRLTRSFSACKPKKTITSSTKSSSELFLSLYNDSKHRKEKLRKMSLEKERKFNSIYTFTPEFVSKHKSSATQQVDFIERLPQYHKAKIRKLNKLKSEIEANTPKPRANTRKLPLSESHLIPASQNFHNTRREKVERIKHEMLQEQGVTFKPVLNSEVNALVKKSVIERNEEFMKQKQLRLEQVKEEKECTFVPKINEMTCDTNGTTESSNRKVGERLYEYREKYLRNLEEKKDRYKESYSFKPSISKNTEEILKQRQRVMDEIKRRYGEEKEGKENGEVEMEIEDKTINELSEENKQVTSNTDKINSLPSVNEERSEQVVNVGVGVNVDMDVGGFANMSDDKFMEMAKNYLSVDDSLDKFQFGSKSNNKLNKGSKSMHNNSNNIINSNNLSIPSNNNNNMSVPNSGSNNKLVYAKKSSSYTPISLPESAPPTFSTKQNKSEIPSKNLMNNLAYYDDL